MSLIIEGREFPFQLHPAEEDERFMLEALRQAWQAYLAEEVPVGAVLVREGRVIARGYNQVEMLQDATAHAEMICITSGANALEGWRLQGTTLYCTLEPCAMCLGALLLSRIDRLVWGAKDVRHGANGSWIDLLDRPHPTHSIEVRRGVYGEVAAELMQDFFRKRRGERGKE